MDKSAHRVRPGPSANRSPRSGRLKSSTRLATARVRQDYSSTRSSVRTWIIFRLRRISRCVRHKADLHAGVSRPTEILNHDYTFHSLAATVTRAFLFGSRFDGVAGFAAAVGFR